MAVPKIEKVRRKLREILPDWMAQHGRAPTMEEFLSEYRMRDDLASSQYSTAKKQVMEELGYAGPNNTDGSAPTNMAQAAIKAEDRLQRDLLRAVKHLMPVMEKGRLEEVTVVLNAETGKFELEHQAAPPPRVKVEL